MPDSKWLDQICVGIAITGFVVVGILTVRACRPEKPDRTQQIIDGVTGVTNAIIDAQKESK